MRKILAGLLSIVGFGNAAAQSPAPSPVQATSELRSMVLALKPGEIGLSPSESPSRVWGVVMETGMDRGYYTLVVLGDGTTSLYFSNGGGIIGAGERESVQAPSREFLAAGNQFAAAATPATDTAPPRQGFTKFFLLTFDGLRTYTAPELALVEEHDSLSPLFYAGQSVITQLRLVQP